MTYFVSSHFVFTNSQNIIKYYALLYLILLENCLHFFIHENPLEKWWLCCGRRIDCAIVQIPTTNRTISCILLRFLVHHCRRITFHFRNFFHAFNLFISTACLLNCRYWIQAEYMSWHFLQCMCANIGLIYLISN